MMVIGCFIGRFFFGDVVGFGFGGLCIDVGNCVKVVFYEFFDSILGLLLVILGEYLVVCINFEFFVCLGWCFLKIF